MSLNALEDGEGGWPVGYEKKMGQYMRADRAWARELDRHWRAPRRREHIDELNALENEGRTV